MKNPKVHLAIAAALAAAIFVPAFSHSQSSAVSVPNYVWTDRTLYASSSGSGTSCTAASPCTLTTSISKAAKFDTIILTPGTYETTGITLSKPLRLLGSGTSDQDIPQTRLTTSTALATDLWTNVSGSIYSQPVSGTVLAVYLDDATAYGTDAYYTPVRLTRNTGTPTAPGSNEWGQSGGLVYVNIGADPGTRNLRYVNTAASVITVAKGCTSFEMRGVEVALAGGSGVFLPAQASYPNTNQLNCVEFVLKNCRFIGLWNQTSTGSANGIVIQHPAEGLIEGCVAINIDNDGLNVKQNSYVKVLSWFSARTGDEGISPHYGATLDCRDVEIRESGYLATADGHGIAVWEGGKLTVDGLTIFQPRGNGVIISGGTGNDAASHATIRNFRITGGLRGTDTSGSVNGIELIYRGSCVVEDGLISGFYNTAGSSGRGLYVRNGTSGVRATMLARNVKLVGNRINIGAEFTGTTAGSRIDAFQITNTRIWHPTTGQSGLFNNLSGGTTTIDWDESGTTGGTTVTHPSAPAGAGYASFSYY